MLKPKKEVFRKEIERDAFLDTIDKAEANFEKNKSKYLYAAISVLIVAILSNFYLNNTEKRKNESNSSMGQALLALSRGDLQNAKIQFETIISDYSGSDIAHLSNYYVGKIEFENKNYTISDEYIRKYLQKSSNKVFIPSAYIMLSTIANDQSNDYQSAISLLDEGIELTNDVHWLRTLKLEKARIKIRNGENGDAKMIINQVYNEKDLNAQEKMIAEQLLGSLAG